MKKILVLMLLLSNLVCFSQKITIKGVALDTTKGRNTVVVVLNDTVRKASVDTSFKIEEYAKLYKDSNFVVVAKADGQFHINVNKGDSLFFQSNRHITKSYAVRDLLKMDDIRVLLEPQICKPYVECVDSMPKHFVFIGEKIRVGRSEEEYICNHKCPNKLIKFCYTCVDLFQTSIFGLYSKKKLKIILLEQHFLR